MPHRTQIIHLTGTLRGTDLREVWVVDGLICHTPPRELAEPSSEADSGVIDIHGFVYPGLLDAHTHPGMGYSPQLISDEEITRRLTACRRFGVTHIRDAGSQRNANEVWHKGMPKVIHCGQHIARFKRYERYLAVDVEPENFVDEVLRQAAVSNGWVKVVADWIDRSLPKPDFAPLWSADILRDGVAAAHDMGCKVTVHTFARETVRRVLDAGVDGIEHGTGMSFDQMVEARERGIVLNPTVFQVNRFPEFAAQGHRFPVYMERMLGMHERLDERLAQMVEADSLFVMGTDTAANVGERPLPVELVTAVAHGMPTSVAMAAASYAGRERLGLTTWEEGACADFVVYAKDPESDIYETMNPLAVLIDGILV